MKVGSCLLERFDGRYCDGGGDGSGGGGDGGGGDAWDGEDCFSFNPSLSEAGEACNARRIWTVNEYNYCDDESDYDDDAGDDGDHDGDDSDDGDHDGDHDGDAGDDDDSETWLECQALLQSTSLIGREVPMA